MPDNCENCQVSVRVDAMQKEFDHYRNNSSQTHKEMFDRLRALENATAVQDNKLETIDDKLNNIQANQATLLASIDELKAKPGKRWEALVGSVITTIIGVVLGFMAAKLGLK